MDDGRETSVQTDMFLILTCDSFEHYLLNIHQFILHTISRILQSFKEEIFVSLSEKEEEKRYLLWK